MRSLHLKTNVNAPNAQYPYGRVRDDDGTGNGTPVDEMLVGDIMQFFSRLMALSGITPNEVPDNLYTTFQLVQALENVISIQVGDKNATDLNNVIRAGSYIIENADTNKPSGLTVGQLIVSGHFLEIPVYQRATDIATGAEWTRVFTGSWTAWNPTSVPYSDPSAWTNVTLLNGWASVTGATVQRRINTVTKTVELRGRLDASGSISAIFADAPNLPDPDYAGMVSPSLRVPIARDDQNLTILSKTGSGWQIIAAGYDTARQYDLTGVIYYVP